MSAEAPAVAHPIPVPHANCEYIRSLGRLTIEAAISL
jgi:hypothetical protein